MPNLKIYILIFSEAVEGKTFDLTSGNPGIGGTEFTSIRLALALAEKCLDWQVILVNSTNIKIRNHASNLKQEVYANPSEFFNLLALDCKMVVISAMRILEKVPDSLLTPVQSKLIGWSRHPFDSSIRRLSNQVRFAGIVCVGVYQFYSNKTFDSLHHIQNVFLCPPIKDDDKKGFTSAHKQINIVYLGALIPGKGFLEVAKSWSNLKGKFHNVVLHVIGSSSTYGNHNKVFRKDLIPADATYSKKILSFIPEKDILSGEVIFHGNLGEEKFDILRKCDFAILNPTGFTEAFPASPLECMACGLPVIASDDYGMSDCMRFFPELVTDGHKNIVERAEWLLADPLRHQELQQRSIAVAQWFASQNDQIITRWVRLIDAVASENAQNLNLNPIMPFYGSKTVLIWRRDVRPKLVRLNHMRQDALKALRIKT